MKVRVKESIKSRPLNFNIDGLMDYMLVFPRPILKVTSETDSTYHVQCLKDASNWWILNKEDCEVVEEMSAFNWNFLKNVGISPSTIGLTVKKHVDFLPTKVIFNGKKGKTTLLFGEAPYKVFTSVASHGDKFDITTGFYVTMLKRLYNDADRKIKLAYDLYEEKRDRNFFIEGLMFAKLQKYGMSNRQFEKLVVDVVLEEKIKFVINGVEHIIQIEY